MESQSIGTFEALVRTEAMYIGVYDIGSPVNTPGIAGVAARFAKESTGEFELSRFNQFWMDRELRGELFAWTLFVDGVYRIRLVLDAANTAAPGVVELGRSLGATAREGFLLCPSGELAVNSIEQFGEAGVGRFARVPPGVYRVRLEVDATEVSKHEFLEALEEYPDGDGPDWTLHLNRIAADALPESACS